MSTEQLSSFDRHLWSLHHYILVHWGQYTTFASYNPAIGKHAGLVIWLIPRCEDTFEINQWLTKELESFEVDIEIDSQTYARHTSVIVDELPFVDPYFSREDVNRLAHDAAERFTRWMSDDVNKSLARLHRARTWRTISVVLDFVGAAAVIISPTLLNLTPAATLAFCGLYLVGVTAQTACNRSWRLLK